MHVAETLLVFNSSVQFMKQSWNCDLAVETVQCKLNACNIPHVCIRLLQRI